MKITEIRDLDGPNLFLPGPAIKLEVEIADGEQIRVVDGSGAQVDATPDDLMARLQTSVRDLHQRLALETPTFAARAMEAPGHYVVAFSWTHRRLAEALAERAFALVSGERRDLDAIVHELQGIRNSAPDEDDAPEMLPTAKRTLPIIAITGTNGKTTTSRLISSVLRHAGRGVGTTSSAGVFINGEQVISGDYSGPSGAQRVFREPGLDVGVLETARGGMLLRGLAYETADVGVVTNVSADHLGLHGVYTVEGLAEVKSLVVRYLRPGRFRRAERRRPSRARDAGRDAGAAVPCYQAGGLSGGAGPYRRRWLGVDGRR